MNEIRGDLGALQNRLNYTVNNLSSISNQTQGARGRIMDADFAQETTALTKQQILSQAATSMLAQANQSKQSILALCFKAKNPTNKNSPSQKLGLFL